MRCPKCGHENQSEREECVRCGVIFAKVRQGALPQTLSMSDAVDPADPADPAGSDRVAFGDLLIPDSESEDGWRL